MAYAEAPTYTSGATSRVIPPSKWLTKPSEVNGRTKNAVSETVLESPALPKGVTRPILWLTVLVQSTVARPVLSPLLLSPVGAVPSIVELNFSTSLSTLKRNPTYAFPSPLTKPVLTCCVAVDEPFTK